MLFRSDNSRSVVLRIGAVLLGLSPLLLAELIFVLLGWGRPQDHGDPFVGFRSTRPLFVRNEAENVFQVASNRQRCFRPESFSATKQPGEFRIFCLGGSTVQGRPFAIETSFTTWLELSLRAADPSRHWDVVNCGGISYASYRLVPILREVLSYDPDLVVLYTGHNEFLEERTYGHIKRQPAPLAYAIHAASRLRSFTLLRERLLDRDVDGAGSTSGVRPILSEEVEALLDYQGGLGAYRRDPSWRRGVIEHFHFNLRRMVLMCRNAAVPIWLVDPVCNLRNCPPFKSQHRDGLTADQLQQWETLRSQAGKYYRTNLRKAVECLRQAIQIDDQYAGQFYDLAKCYDSLGSPNEAREAYIRSKELDVCPLRVVEAMNRAIHDVAQETGTTLIPVRESFNRHSRDSIPGGFLLVDHVHPSIPGHKRIAELLLDQCVASGTSTPRKGWQQRRDDLFQSHAQSLDDWYYLEGQRRLENLRGWAQGRSEFTRQSPVRD